MKIVAGQKYREVLGVHIIGPCASDLIPEGRPGDLARGHARGRRQHDPRPPHPRRDRHGGGHGRARAAGPHRAAPQALRSIVTTTTAPRKATRKATRPAAPTPNTKSANGTDLAEPPFGGESPDRLRELYRDMLFVRRFEERTAQAYQQAKIGGYCHLNLGEEATVVGWAPPCARPTTSSPTTASTGTRSRSGIEPGSGHGRAVRPLDRHLARAGAVRCTCTTPPPGCWAATPSSAARFRSRSARALAIDYRGGEDVVRSACSATAPPISAPSTSRSTSRRCGSCRSCSW